MLHCTGFMKGFAMNDVKAALAEKILAVKKQKGLSWRDIAAAVGHSPVWTCAACLGQMSMAPETAIPYRGSLPSTPPTDPLIYRFHELVSVYGTTWKEIIHEEFGDGIMSAIDFEMAMERQPDPKGDRVRITMSGKFLPYKSY